MAEVRSFGYFENSFKIGRWNAQDVSLLTSEKCVLQSPQGTKYDTLWDLAISWIIQFARLASDIYGILFLWCLYVQAVPSIIHGIYFIVAYIARANDEKDGLFASLGVKAILGQPFLSEIFRRVDFLVRQPRARETIVSLVMIGRRA